MAISKEEAFENIQKKLGRCIDLKCEIDNPYIEQYINEDIKALVEEIFNAIDDRSKKFLSDFNTNIRLR